MSALSSLKNNITGLYATIIFMLTMLTCELKHRGPGQMLVLTSESYVKTGPISCIGNLQTHETLMASLMISACYFLIRSHGLLRLLCSRLICMVNC